MIRERSARRRAILTGVFGLAALGPSACGTPGAPADPGVCWRATAARNGRPAFAVLARNVATLDDCAAELEALHLMGAREVRGAFQGYFIHIDARQVASSTQPDGFGYPIFQPGQRKEIDADLTALIKARAGKPPSAGDISVERK